MRNASTRNRLNMPTKSRNNSKENSMSEFVARGWGAKDYAHINYSGGKYIAKAFVNALLWEKQNRYQTDVKKDSVEVDSSQNVVVAR